MNDNFWQLLIAVLGGSGVWEFIKFEIEKHRKKLSDEQKLILGIAHDRIWYLGGQYIRRGGITKSTVHASVKKFSITGGRELCLIDVDSWYNGKPAFSNVYGKSNYAGAPGIIDSIKFILTYYNNSDSGVITVASETIIGESGFRCASTGFGSIYGFVIPVSYKIYRLK